VRDPFAMRVVQARRQLFEDIQRLPRRQASLLLEYLGQRSSLHKSRHQVGEASLLTKVVRRENVGMLQPDKRRPFLGKALSKTLAHRNAIGEVERRQHDGAALWLMLGHIHSA